MSSGRIVVLGCIHIAVGLATIGLRFFSDLDVVGWLIGFVAHLPLYGLVAVGAIKGIYGVGGPFPGTTLMLLFFLGRDCSVSEFAGPVVAVWLGVTVGLGISFILGRSVTRIKHPDRIPPNWRDIAWAIHPNLAATYFFEAGYSSQRFWPRIVLFAVVGIILLGIYGLGICGFKEAISSQTRELGTVWGLVLVGLGATRVARGLKEPKPF
jgi:hypothetical protein